MGANLPGKLLCKPALPGGYPGTALGMNM